QRAPHCLDVYWSSYADPLSHAHGMSNETGESSIFVQRPVIFATRINLPHRALVERLASRWCAGYYLTHADIPQVRIISIPSSERRALVQTGSQTMSI